MAIPPPQDPTPHAGSGDSSREGTPENARHSHGPGRNGQDPHAHLPALRRTVVRPAGATPDPVDAAFVANRLTTLTHELSTLLDGSLRVIGIARRSIAGPETLDRHGKRDICPEQLARHLETVDAAMRQMAELVRCTMIGMAENGALGVRPGGGFGSSSSLADAVQHAVDVMTPLAEEQHVRLEAQIGADLAAIAAGPIYAVITNGVRNAIESIRRVGDRVVGGRIVVRCWTESGKTGRCVMLTIEDDGAGLARGDAERRARSPERPKPAESGSFFSLGFSTKPGGSGIGLSLSRDVIEQLGGTIELHARARDPKSGRAGAVLSVCYPVPKLHIAG